MVHKGAEARLARTQPVLGLAQLGDVLQDAKLAHRPSQVVPRDVALAVDCPYGAVRTHHAIFQEERGPPRTSAAAAAWAAPARSSG